VSPKEQRIAIAEEWGWSLKHCEWHNTTTWHSPEGLCAIGDDCSVLPDYLNDFNAINSAVKKLSKDDQSLWYDILALDCPDDPEADIAQMKWKTHWFVAVEATAAQRAEAFLRTIGKWEES
jgi:hypothetical protein